MSTLSKVAHKMCERCGEVSAVSATVADQLLFVATAIVAFGCHISLRASWAGPH